MKLTVVSAAALTLLLPALATAAPEHVRVSWCGGSSGTTMCVTWNDPSGGGNQVHYGLDQSLPLSVQATAIAGPAQLGTIYEAELVNLSPNTEYNYRVGGGGSPWSPTYTFRTGPPDGDPCLPFRFVVLGDNRSQDESGADIKWNSILTEAVEHDPAFVLNTGDLVKDGDQVAQWKDYLEKTDPIQAYVPLLPSIGNHDDDKLQGEGALYNMVHQLPRNTETNTEDFYYVTYGDAIVVSLTTQNFKSDAFEMQAQWLDQVLTENPRRWKFVYFHHPNYASFGDVFGAELGHPPNEQGQNAALVPIFDKHHVDMVFSGHNHWYERFGPMKGGGGADQGKPVGSPAEGTIYMITGGAGAFTFDGIEIGDFEINPLEWFCGTAVGSLQCDGRHHYVAIEIDGNELSMEVWATAGQNFDTSPENIELIDTLTITKDDPLQCAEPPDPVEPDPELGGEAEPPPEEPNVAEPPPEMPDTITPDPDTGGTDGTESTDGTGATDGAGTGATDGTDSTDGAASDGADATDGQDGTDSAQPSTDLGGSSVPPAADDGGCQSSPGGFSGGPVLLIILGLAVVFIRRVKRRTVGA